MVSNAFAFVAILFNPAFAAAPATTLAPSSIATPTPASPPVATIAATSPNAAPLFAVFSLNPAFSFIFFCKSPTAAAVPPISLNFLASSSNLFPIIGSLPNIAARKLSIEPKIKSTNEAIPFIIPKPAFKIKPPISLTPSIALEKSPVNTPVTIFHISLIAPTTPPKARTNVLNKLSNTAKTGVKSVIISLKFCPISANVALIFETSCSGIISPADTAFVFVDSKPSLIAPTIASIYASGVFPVTAATSPLACCPAFSIPLFADANALILSAAIPTKTSLLLVRKSTIVTPSLAKALIIS